MSRPGSMRYEPVDLRPPSQHGIKPCIQYPHYAYSAVDLNFTERKSEVPSIYKQNRKLFSSTWSPHKIKCDERPVPKKRVKFASTWGPLHPVPGEYATINPKKLHSRYVRPAVFMRTNLKDSTTFQTDI